MMVRYPEPKAAEPANMAGCKPWRVEWDEFDEEKKEWVRRKEGGIKGYAKAVRWARTNLAPGILYEVVEDGQGCC